MKNKSHTTSMIKAAFLSACCFLLSPQIRAQANITVPSANGYNVNISLNPLAIIAPTSCPWGYNFNTRFSYNVGFTGTNIPSALYTLQTYLYCGSYSNFSQLPLSGGSGTRVTTSNPWNGNSDCSTATPASLGCITFNVIINGPGIPSQSISASLAALPVELLRFSAISSSQAVKLDWATVQENNNAYFRIERSIDGTSWQGISEVEAIVDGSVIKQYSTLDNHPVQGYSFYRLKQVDQDGSFTCSSIIVVDRKPEPKLIIYPNPAADEFSLDVQELESAEVTILDCYGKQVRLDPEHKNGQLVYRTESLASGLYFVSAVIEGAEVKQKLTICKS